MPKIIHQIPKSGYLPNGLLDAMESDEDVHCEVCNRRLRWVHLISHFALDHPVGVGCICAAKMCSTYDAKGAETDGKNRAERLRRFLNNGKWKRSVKGNLTRKYKKLKVTVFEGYGMWKYSIKPPKQTVIYSHVGFNTEAEAKLGAFDWYENFVE